MTIDISVVLSVACEVKYLKRTLASLEEAAFHAQGAGLGVALSVVLDRPSVSAAAWMAGYDASAFDAFRVLAADTGSPWGSLYEGVRSAPGEYVFLCAAGELVSRSLLARMHALAASLGREAVLAPEHAVHVGDAPRLVRHYGCDRVPGTALVGCNPYPAALFLRRELFLDVASRSFRPPEDAAGEPWRFNCDAVALGCRFHAAPGTILFTRDAQTSAARSEDWLQAGLPRRSLLFEPANFLALSRGATQEHPDPAGILHEFLNDSGNVELLHAANAIDPAIHMEMFDYCRPSDNLERDPAPGEAYRTLCGAAGTEPFTDVFLLPFFTKGGADKVILGVIEGLRDMAPGGRILMVCGESFERHSWLERLPGNVVFLDLPRLLPGLPVKHMDAACLRLVQALGRGARLHLKPSHFAFRFFRKFSAALPENFVVTYRFSNYMYESHGLKFVNGYFFNFISDHLERLDRIVTDNEAVIAFDRQRLACDSQRWQSLDVKCAPLTTPERIRARGRAYRRRLLWASRLDHEKRPEMLALLAAKLAEKKLDVAIDVYGSAVLDDFSPERLEAGGVLRYLGPFEAFESLPHDSYDGFVYTTAFDGMPNVVLEALAAGLPVIAPDVGGISRAVIDGATGFLLPDLADDEVLAEAYVQAIEKLYADPKAHERLRLGALDLILTRHGEARFNARLAQILGVEA